LANVATNVPYDIGGQLSARQVREPPEDGVVSRIARNMVVCEHGSHFVVPRLKKIVSLPNQLKARLQIAHEIAVTEQKRCSSLCWLW